MTATHDDDFDPEHPDRQHEEPGESTDDQADFQPGEGTEPNPGEAPPELPDPEEEEDD